MEAHPHPHQQPATNHPDADQKRRRRPYRGKGKTVQQTDASEASSPAAIGESSYTGAAGEAQILAPPQARRPRPPRQPRPPRPRANPPQAPSATLPHPEPLQNVPTATNPEVDASQPPRRKRTRNRNKGPADEAGNQHLHQHQQQNHQQQNHQQQHQFHQHEADALPVPYFGGGGGRRRAFGAQLSGAAPPEQHTHTPVLHMRPEAATFTPTYSSTPTGPEDIPTRIHREIEDGSYECMVCYNSVTRKNKVWSCHCCWAVYHLHCIRKWAKEKLQEKTTAPIGVDGEPPRFWKCPACNNPNKAPPELYTCWCGKDSQPENNRYTPPHSCGQTCGKQLTNPKKCPHACTQQCHAGPCPPCVAMGPVQTCFCGKESHQKRCVDTDYEGGWSCGQVCGDYMPCGEHTCLRSCHPLLCGSCEVTELVKCYCGNEMRDIKCCDKEDPKESIRIHHDSDEEFSDGDEVEEWMGYYECRKICNRYLACGIHRCGKKCHPQDPEAGICPSDPQVVTHCPCGKTPLTELLSEPRPNCEAPIPSCKKVCYKVLPCGHHCTQTCHDGECGVCLKKVDIPCRCGKTISTTLCQQGEDIEPPQCMRSCRVSLNCGRHECGEKCCSGEMKAQERMSSKKRMRPLASTPGLQTDDGFEPEHICTRPCGRLLKCGKHNCSMLCHRGACGTCLEASFDELVCKCGRTAIQPPVPCGSKPPVCRFPCNRPKLCGHPPVPHDCHPDEEECPKCPYLTEKLCKCGKKAVKAVSCWRTGVSCGMICGKKLSCGSHLCRTPCHDGECEEPCRQKCGKPKPTCGHPCQDSCHAPFQCSEEKLCMEKLRLTCPCGGVKQDIKCGATKAKPAGNQKEIACTDACRVRRLAMALDIDPEREGGTTPSYTDETVAIYNKNPGWAPAIESKFRSFVENKEQKRLQFRPMQVIQREFCHLLAVDLGLDSESQDPEPYRSVVIRKPANFTTAPRKTIAEFIGVKPPGSSGATAVLQLKKISRGQAVNAFVLKGIQVGMLASDLEKEIAPTLKESQLRFDIAWHGDEDVLLKPRASSLAVDQVETELHSLSTKLKRVIALKGLADSTELCWVGQDGRIANSGASGWSLANPRKSAPSSSWSTGPMLASRNVFDLFSGAGGSSAATITATQLATKREKERLEKERLKEKEKEKMKEVVDSWEMEADEDDEGAGSDRPAEGSNQGASNAPSMEDKPSNSSEPEVSSSTTEVEVRPADS